MLDATDPLVSGSTEGANVHFTNLAAFDESEPSLVDRMAELIIARSKDGQPTHWGDLKAKGFTTSQIGAHFPAASRLASQTVIRQDAIDIPTGNPWDQDAAYRAERIALAAGTLAGMMPTEAEAIALLRAGNRFGTRELGDLWPEIVDATAQLAVEKIGVRP